MPDLAEMLLAARGRRPDGSPKGPGFLGELQRPGGGYSSELSIGVDGELMPLLVPGQDNVEGLLQGAEITPAMVLKAIRHARERQMQGEDAFAGTLADKLGL